MDSALGQALPSREVVSFVRIKDMEEMLSAYPLAPLITTAAYVRYLPDREILLKGKSGAGRGNKYVVIAANAGISPADLASCRIGMLDFLGRDKLPLFVRDAFGLRLTKLKRVNKREDLLSLLGMESVDAAVIEESYLAEMRAGTRLPIAVLLESKPMDTFPVLAAPAGTDWHGLKAALAKLPKETLRSMGIEEWE